MKRKLILMVLMLVVGALILAACNRGEPATPAPPPQDTTTPSTQATTPQQGAGTETVTETVTDPQEDAPFFPLAEPITIRKLITHNPHEDLGYQRIAWQVLEAHTNITVDYSWLVDYEQQLPLILAAGDWPDVFWNELAPDVINEFGVVGGRFVNYIDWLDDMPHLSNMFDMLPDARRGRTSPNGAVYQLMSFSPAATSYQYRMHIRTDLIEQTGLGRPNTTEEFYELGIALRDMLDHPPLPGRQAWGWFFSAFGPGVEQDWDVPFNDGVVHFMRTSDQGRDYLRFMNRLFESGILHPEYLTMDAATTQALTNEGRFAFAQSELQIIPIESFPSGNWDVCVLAPLISPQYAGRTIRSGQAPWGATALRGGAINADSPHVEAIVRMHDTFFALEPYQVDVGGGQIVPLQGSNFVWGPQGITWDYTAWDANGNPTEHAQFFPEYFMGVNYGLDFPWNTTTQQTQIMFNSPFGLSLVFENTIVADGSNAEARSRGAVAYSLPFARSWWWPPSIVNADEQMIVDQFWVEINNHRDMMEARFIMGLACLDNDWDDYVAQMNAMGLPQVLAVRQAAYDRWMAAGN